MSGHVFVVHGDLRYFACDAWLASGDRRAYLDERRWKPPDYPPDLPVHAERFTDGGPRAVLLDRGAKRKPNDPASRDRPQLWLGRIGQKSDPNAPAKWYLEGALEFLHRAAESVKDREPLYDRAAPLLALPVVGTGEGGAAQWAGVIVSALLPELLKFVAHSKGKYGRVFDVALVCFDAATHAAAQAERAKAYKWTDEELPPHQRVAARDLAKRARNDKLALFLGAGVSAPAGLPRWADLISQLAHNAGMSELERKQLAAVGSALDQAAIVERWLEKRNADATDGAEKLTIGDAVSKVLGGYHRYSLTHALLAALPVREVITTNYDQFFDRAWALSDPTGISVLPDGLRENGRRWLLKMHGCLSNPKRVVLTRSSYIRYDEDLPALAGLVQGLLLTRHILFVGFSMNDDNFHRLVDGVRRLRGDVKGETHFGTALWLGKDELGEVLWSKDVPRVRMSEHPEVPWSEFPHKEAGRRLQIFLDYLVSETREAAHLLDGPHFASLLSAGEKEIHDALQKLADLRRGPHAAQVRDTVAWPRIVRLLRGLGFDLPDEPE